MPLTIQPPFPLGEWGVFPFSQFMDDFSRSREFLQAPLEGYYDYQAAIESLISGHDDLRDSLTVGLPMALYAFAERTMPLRMQDDLGLSIVYNPQRDRRVGARPSVPIRVPTSSCPFWQATATRATR
jgi:hypothetical protein